MIADENSPLCFRIHLIENITLETPPPPNFSRITHFPSHLSHSLYPQNPFPQSTLSSTYLIKILSSQISPQEQTQKQKVAPH